MKVNRRTQLPAPWVRSDGGRGKLFASYAHPSGYRIQHCGHPTANWPYALYGPDGTLLVGRNGRAFQTLALAAEEAEAHLAVDRQLAVTRPKRSNRRA